MASNLEPISYRQALEKLNTARNRVEGKRLSATARLFGASFDENAEPVDVGVRLHYTDILIFHADGSVTFNSGGYRTPTTKRWMGLAADHAQVFQRDFAWYITPNTADRPHSWEYADFDSWLAADKEWRKRVTVPFVDGMRVTQDGEIA